MSDKKVANTPVMKQFLEIKEKYKDSILLFRMGDFYETFLNDAIITSKILGIVLTKRSNGKASNVDLAGFPYHSLDNYLPKLVKAGHRVAICEQVEDPKKVKGIVKREVVEVVTPGTLLSDRTLNHKSNRYIGSLQIIKNNVGYAFLDSATGDFNIGECRYSDFKTIILKYLPHVIVISDDITYSNSSWYVEFKPFISPINRFMFDYNTSKRELLEHFEVKSLKGFGCEHLYLGISAAGALMQHMKNNLISNLQHVSKLSPILKDDIMGLDNFTVKNLEIFNSLSTQGQQGTLIDSIDCTLTAGGGRLLRNWLINPIIKLDRINARLSSTEAFFKNKKTLSIIRKNLTSVSDSQRIVGKISNSKVSPREMITLSHTLEKINEIKKYLISQNNKILKEIGISILNNSHIFKKISLTVSNLPPNNISDGGSIISGYSSELDDLRHLMNNGKKWIKNYQETMRAELGITKLKISFNRVFGYYIEVSKAQRDKIPEKLIRKQTLVNSERYITAELKEYEQKIISAEEKIYNLETNIFKDLCDYILLYIKDIQVNAKIINRIDVFSSFSIHAIENNYTKPVITDKTVLKIKKGRHPVVEKLLPVTEKFIANDLTIDSSINQIQLLTGPNMAGKSTYLRQTGLIALLAHIGSYVPAEKALIGVIDRLFTRVGASDNLAGGESTFLVEMNEAANILNNATNHSLILLDEIGRGTATYDGLSIAWSITEYLHEKEEVRARTIFATHYHELTILDKSLKRLENHYVVVKEHDDNIIFMRSISKGTGDKSYGIQVAKMAGLPKVVIERAKEVLASHLLEKRKSNKKIPKLDFNQINFFREKDSALIKKIKNIDINDITPIEALLILKDLKNEFDN
ncbi:MAG: DNA mismatch repair protein MutS [Candidatus Marinimicrobia bacterium]|nr:DNA mismatch repair protein MutS [Candidatus Neomarinimicrobiota bacterium]